jgi:hypothetical protein
LRKENISHRDWKLINENERPNITQFNLSIFYNFLMIIELENFSFISKVGIPRADTLEDGERRREC